MNSIGGRPQFFMGVSYAAVCFQESDALAFFIFRRSRISACYGVCVGAIISKILIKELRRAC
jgi:hypothetical protein